MAPTWKIPRYSSSGFGNDSLGEFGTGYSRGSYTPSGFGNNPLGEFAGTAASSVGSPPSKVTHVGGDRKAHAAKQRRTLIENGGMKETPVSIADPSGRIGNIDRWYFPLSPLINNSMGSNYQSYDTTHSNFQQKAFSSSMSADLSVVGDVIARDENEAEAVLIGYNFFRAAMKMFWQKDDGLAGFPPPVLRFDAYNLLQNVPVVVTGFSWNLENQVDYIEYNSTVFPGYPVRIPALSTFTLQLSTTYGPKKIRETFSVQEYADGKLHNRGYL